MSDNLKTIVQRALFFPKKKNPNVNGEGIYYAPLMHTSCSFFFYLQFES